MNDKNEERGYQPPTDYGYQPRKINDGYQPNVDQDVSPPTPPKKSSGIK